VDTSELDAQVGTLSSNHEAPRSFAHRSAATSRFKWFTFGAFSLALIIGGVASLVDHTHSAHAKPAFIDSDAVPGAQAFAFTTLSSTNPTPAPGTMSNDPTGSCGFIWHLLIGNVVVHVVAVQALTVNTSSSVTITRLSLGADDGPSAIGPAGRGGAETIPASWSFKLHYRARPGAIFTAYARSDIRSDWWPQGSFEVFKTMLVTYKQNGSVHTTSVTLGHPACVNQPNARR
jgi:hypothetical protein